MSLLQEVKAANLFDEVSELGARVFGFHDLRDSAAVIGLVLLNMALDADLLLTMSM